MEIKSRIHDPAQIERFAQLIQSSSTLQVIFTIDRAKYGGTNKKERFLLCNSLTAEQFREEVELLNFALRNETGNFAFYSTTNGRSKNEAERLLLKRFMSRFVDNNQTRELDRELISAVRRSSAKTECLSFDLDDKKDLPELLEDLTLEPVLKDLEHVPPTIIETRGGYHVLVFRKCSGNLLKKWSRDKKVHLGDIDCPIPGTMQADFPVKFI